MTVYVLGAGPAGLAVAHGLVEKTKTDVMAIERSATLGGLAQTVNWGSCGTHDDTGFDVWRTGLLALLADLNRHFAQLIPIMILLLASMAASLIASKNVRHRRIR